ncbi:MAG: Hsp20/alpha crystallin family protein [Candidatus Marsarchaeota archaeon]|nr:Hsp20/alpha crystallin family protein [Candidatus Marsarchaeota archaeon]
MRKGEKHNIMPVEDKFFEEPFEFFGNRGRLFGELFNEGLSFPSVDIEDKGDSLIVSADIPGMDKKNIKVKVKKDEVVIRAERTESVEKEGKDYYRKERSSSGYYRRIPLPEEVKSNTAKANYQNGTLKIEIKKENEHGGSEVNVE